MRHTDKSPKTPEIVSTADDQINLNLTIYNADRALVKDRRRVTLPSGECALAFREVSARMRPETALLSGGPAILEQNFEYDLLTPEALLRKYVGREVDIVRQNPTTGEDLPPERARVLSAAGGAVFDVAGRIETGMPGRIIYPDVPANLRDRPTLVTLVANKTKGPQEVELSYLSAGLSWKADYVVELSADEQRLNLNGWVTLVNESGASYRDAQLQLVAGEVHVVKEDDYKVERPCFQRRSSAAAPLMKEESLFEYHLYTLGRPTTVAENQQKQVALLQAQNVRARKMLILRGSSSYYDNKAGSLGKKLQLNAELEIKNEKELGLGLPIPAGVMRVYKKDSWGLLQFVGEDRIDHTPDKETIRLRLGKSFDVTASKKQTDFKHKRIGAADSQTFQYTSSYEFTVKNAKDAPAQVKILEPIPGTWEMLEESAPHTKEDAFTVSWILDVPPKGQTVLTYTVKVKL